jgi:hypothetical protein
MVNSTYRSVLKRRERARENGLCITCCKRKPREHHSTCRACVLGANERVKRRRAKLRQSAEASHILIIEEAGGDALYEHHLYDAAAKHRRDCTR